MATREELAWVAGLFEGEGCVSAIVRTHGAPRLNTSVKMTDLDVLERAQRITGLGKVYGPYQRAPHHKPHWQWNVQNAQHAYALVIMLFPWLGSRRRRQVIEKVSLWLTHEDRRERDATSGRYESRV